MNSSELIILFITTGITVVMVGVIVYLFYQQKKRREAIRAFADSSGYTYSEEEDALAEALSARGFTLFQHGHGKHVSNVVRARLERSDVLLFDYRYTIGAGKNSHTYHQTVLVFTHPETALPRFSLRPEKFWDKLADALGSKDINFPEAEVFSKLYRLNGEDEEAVRALFDGEKLDYFTQNPNLYIEAAGDTFLYYRLSRLVKVEELPAFIEAGLEVWRMFKQDVW